MKKAMSSQKHMVGFNVNLLERGVFKIIQTFLKDNANTITYRL